MKFLFEIFPIVLFFIAFRLFNIFVATGVAIASSIVQIAWLISRKRKVEPMQWLSFILILTFGGLTIVLHDESFIKLKPTILYWAFTTVLVFGSLILKKNLIQKAIGEQIQLIPQVAEKIWSTLNWAWAFFFFVMGALNLYIAINFASDFWNNFKLISMGILFVFIIIQGIWLSKYIQATDVESA